LLRSVKKCQGFNSISIGELNDAVTTAAKKGKPAFDLSDKIEITEEYRNIERLINSGNAITFVTGKAGTGKSTLIRYLQNKIEKNIAVVAPTGVAALNVKGSTIHSFFKLPPRIVNDTDIQKVYDRTLYRKLDLLIVDEISMVRADLIDAIDLFLKRNRENNEVFGGVQVLLIGDLFQLPPVVKHSEREILLKKGYKSEFFFSAFSLKGAELKSIELTFVFRQKDLDFIKILDNIRQAKNLDDTLSKINSRCIQSNSYGKEITLTSTNSVADMKNKHELEQLTTPLKVFYGEKEGKFNMKEDRLPSPINLELKIGAQVMFTKNDKQKRWVNGSLGLVEGFENDNIIVRLYENSVEPVVSVRKESWENYEYEYNPEKDKITSKVIGKYTQYPLMLAWAVTIYKGQGKTFSRVLIDLGRGAFAPGQVYVALSRVRSFENIRLARLIRKSEIYTNPIIRKFYQFIFDKSNNVEIENVPEETVDFSKTFNSEHDKERYYGRVLKLKGKVTSRDIKNSYRSMIAKYHPDKVATLGTELKKIARQKTIELNEAYQYFQQKYKF